MIWGWIKAHHRNNCKYNYPALKKGLPITLNELVPIAFVRGAFKTPNNKWVRVCHSKCGVWTRFRTRLLMKFKNGNTEQEVNIPYDHLTSLSTTSHFQCYHLRAFQFAMFWRILLGVLCHDAILDTMGKLEFWRLMSQKCKQGWISLSD